MTLDQLPRDTRATVTALESRGAERRRLMDLGLLPGVEVQVDMVSPLGDPTAYVVRGSMIALRRSQARAIHVEPQEK
jgi:ferrous iron transport protein A